MSYQIIFKPSFLKDLKKIPKDVREKVQSIVENVRRDPFIMASKRLVGYTNLYRYRLGDYRLVYYVNSEQKKVIFLLVAHRKDVYRSL